MSNSTQPTVKTNYALSIGIIGVFFFVFGFVTWLNGILIPYLKIACQLNDFQSYLVAFAFYISYVVMALPSAWVLQKTGLKNGMMVGLLVMAVGTVLFIPAAYTRTYFLFLLGLFVLGTGLAILQTASNPYVTILGPIDRAAQRISIMGICNKVAGVISPLILGAIVLKDSDALVERLKTMSDAAKAVELDALSQRVVVPYLIMTGILVALAGLVRYANLPEVESGTDDTHGDAAANKTSVFDFPYLVLGVIALFLYVGCEVMAGDTIINYGKSLGIPLSTAKVFTSYTLGAMVVGYILGIIAIPKYIQQDKALAVSAVVGLILSVGATVVSGYNSILCIALLGLANALMWPAIWPLAISGLGRFTKIGSSLLVMAIAGGAIFPLIYGKLVGSVGSQQAYWILVPCYGFILYYALVGHKKLNW